LCDIIVYLSWFHHRNESVQDNHLSFSSLQPDCKHHCILREAKFVLFYQTSVFSFRCTVKDSARVLGQHFVCWSQTHLRIRRKSRRHSSPETACARAFLPSIIKKALGCLPFCFQELQAPARVGGQTPNGVAGASTDTLPKSWSPLWR
jgi:hypothetical protein